MDLKEEIELLERKLELLKEIQALETLKPYVPPTYSIHPKYPTYPTDGLGITDTTIAEFSLPEDLKIPSRLLDVDPVIAELMLRPECNKLS